LQYFGVFLWILYRLLWGYTAWTVSGFVVCLHSVSDSMSVTVLLLICHVYRECLKSFDNIFREQWREQIGTWLDNRCGGVGSSNTEWAGTLCPLAVLLLIWQHWWWCLFWTFRITTCHSAKFYFLLWINTWVRTSVASWNMRPMCLHVVIRDRVISEQSRSAALNF
jgi:hypothetical protein